MTNKQNTKWSIQLSKQHRDNLKKHCKENGLSMSGYVESLLDRNIPKRINPNDEIFWQSYEPKVNNRFIVYITNKKNEIVIPAFVIKSINRPSIENNNSKQIFSLTCYDPIVPSIPQCIKLLISKNEKLNIKLNILGPTGDKIEEWQYNNCLISSVKYSELNWESIQQPSEIILYLITDTIILNF